MRSWPAPMLPRLPGNGPVPRVFDTATGSLQPIEPAEPDAPARMYVCGITPYDATHIGHAFTYLTYDLLHRLLLDSGRDVHYVQNVTDVDDPLLERAERDGVDWRALAAAEIERFRGDMTALRILPPTHYIGAVEAVPVIIDMITQLRERGSVYQVDHDLYFAVAGSPRFGSVSHLSHAEMVTRCADNGGDPGRAGKKDPVDPLLWRGHRPGEPAWDSPFGPGRPGWHVECAAIARTYLGDTVDVQGGGRDLIFPHHECSAAHSEAASGQAPFARAYVHSGLVALDGRKMSKSLGNLEFVSRLRARGADPAAVRMALLDHHYRADWEWDAGLLDEASRRLDRWRSAAARHPAPPVAGLLGEVRQRLADDLDAPGALAAVDRWSAAALSGAVSGALSDEGTFGDDRCGGDTDGDALLHPVAVDDAAAAPATMRSITDALLGIDLEPVRPTGG